MARPSARVAASAPCLAAPAAAKMAPRAVAGVSCGSTETYLMPSGPKLLVVDWCEVTSTGARARKGSVQRTGLDGAGYQIFDNRR